MKIIVQLLKWIWKYFGRYISAILFRWVWKIIEKIIENRKKRKAEKVKTALTNNDFSINKEPEKKENKLLAKNNRKRTRGRHIQVLPNGKQIRHGFK